MTDALGLPVRFILTGGQATDMTQVIPLMQGITTGALLADKCYGADVWIDWLKEREITEVIPPKANRKVKKEVATDACKRSVMSSIACLSSSSISAESPHVIRKRPTISKNVGLCSSFIAATLVRQPSVIKKPAGDKPTGFLKN